MNAKTLCQQVVKFVWILTVCAFIIFVVNLFLSGGRDIPVQAGDSCVTELADGWNYDNAKIVSFPFSHLNDGNESYYIERYLQNIPPADGDLFLYFNP